MHCEGMVLMSDARNITVAKIAEHIGGTLEGNGTAIVSTLAPLEQAGADAISWVGAPEFFEKIAATKAAAVIVPLDGMMPAGCAGHVIIRVADPDAAMIEVLAMLAPPLDRITPGVHPSAVVDEDAVVEGAAIGPHVVVGANVTIGAGTQLHAGVSVGSGVTIGRDGVLWPGVVLRERTWVGDRVIIHANTTIGTDGFGYLFRKGEHKKIPQIGSVVIEDDVEIGACTTIDRARSGVTRIRKGTKIDNLVMIAHNCDIGEHSVIAAQCGIAGSVVTGRYCAFGGRSGASDHLTLGDGVQMAACSVATRDFPGGMVLRGMPAIDSRRFVREQAAARKLPEALKEIRALVRRVAALEAQLADRA